MVATRMFRWNCASVICAARLSFRAVEAIIKASKRPAKSFFIDPQVGSLGSKAGKVSKGRD